MIPVDLDTNVLRAALLKPTGPNMAALHRIVARRTTFQVCYSSQMFSEYEDVLSRPVVAGRGLGPEARALLCVIQSVAQEAN